MEREREEREEIIDGPVCHHRKDPFVQLLNEQHTLKLKDGEAGDRKEGGMDGGREG